MNGPDGCGGFMLVPPAGSVRVGFEIEYNVGDAIVAM
jgi:hypothetical protein